MHVEVVAQNSSNKCGKSGGSRWNCGFTRKQASGMAGLAPGSNGTVNGANPELSGLTISIRTPCALTNVFGPVGRALDQSDVLWTIGGFLWTHGANPEI